MKLYPLLLGFALTATAGAQAILTSHQTERIAWNGPQVTWRETVAPIVYRNCSSCHHTGGSGPFALTTYPQARRWGAQMQQVTQSRYMPPWLPAPGHGHFAGDRSLGAADIAAIKQWVQAGMPEGTGRAPVAPVYSSDWQLGPPDLVVEMPQATTVPASGTDLFMNFVLPVSITATKWVRAMEIKPGAASADSTQVTHHANVIVDRTSSVRRDHPATWKQGVPGMDIMVDSGDDFDPDSHFLFWKPDSTALVEPNGMPWRLDPGNDLVLNMHLKPTGKPESVRARIGLYFTQQPATEHPMLLQLENDAALDIPAGDAAFVIEDRLTLPVAVQLLGLYPHAHYLGKRMEAWAQLPAGSTLPILAGQTLPERRDLILIEDWDIDRQSVYRLQQPMLLPAGTVLHMRYTYDNSAANPHNPNAPPIRVRAGNRSVDEMGHLWLQVLPVDRAADGQPDPRIALERAWMQNRLSRNAQDEIAMYNLAAMDTTEGNGDAAEAMYRQLLQRKPNDARTLTSLGAAMLSTGDWQGAQTQWRTALAAAPAYADAAFDLASVDLQHDALSEAEGLLLGLTAQQPGDAQSQRLLAMVYAAQALPEKALPHLQAWQLLAPTDADPHRALAQVYVQIGQTNDALREQRLVVALAPSAADDWNDLGVMEAQSGDKTRARRDLNHALELQPDNAAAKANLAKLN